MAKDAPNDPQAPRPVIVLPTDRQMSTVRFSPCGNFLAAAGRDATIRFWHCSPPSLTPEAPANAADAKDSKSSPAPPPSAEFSERPPLKGHDGWVTRIEFHPRDKRLIAADSWGQLCAWQYDAEQMPPAWQLKQAHDGWIRQLAISPDGSQLATCGIDKMIRVWSATDGAKLLELLAGEDVLSIAFAPDGKSLVSGDLRGVVKHWDLAAQQVVREFDASIFYLLSFIQDVGGVRSLAFDAEGNTLAAAGAQPAGGGFVQGTPVIRFFDWATGQETQTLKLGDNTEVYIHELTFHPRGVWLGVVSGQPGKGKFFLLKPGESEPFFTSKGLANCHSVAMHPNGVRFAVIANAGTSGQQRSKAREGIYPGNTSPIHVLDLAHA
jgi:WD40 repeat protein